MNHLERAKEKIFSTKEKEMNNQTEERKCSTCDVDILRTKKFLVTGEALYECPVCGGLIAEGAFDEEE